MANDTLGHDAGDILLKKEAKCIQEAFGNSQSNNCFRMGGDEYIAYLLDTDKETMEKHLENFRTLQASYDISISVGYAQGKCQNGEDFHKILKEADEAMYANKVATKKCCGKKPR